MKRVAKMICALAMAMLLAMSAAAAESDSVWMNVTDSSDGVVVTITSDAAVTDGLIQLSYDSSKLTYVGVETNEAYVAMYAVNAEEAGTVKISWVAPGEYQTDGKANGLIQVNFTGAEDADIELTGLVHDADGSSISLTELDTAELESAVSAAEALKEEDYTSDSYAAVEQALEQAKKVLSNVTATQAEVDAAEKALQDAIDGLVAAPSAEGTTEGTGEDASGNPNNSQTGDTTATGLAIAVMAVCAVGIVVVAVIMKRKGNAQ